AGGGPITRELAVRARPFVLSPAFSCGRPEKRSTFQFGEQHRERAYDRGPTGSAVCLRTAHGSRCCRLGLPRQQGGKVFAHRLLSSRTALAMALSRPSSGGK